MARHSIARLVAAVVIAALAPALLAQDEEFTFVISVFDADGRPVRDLKRDEIVLSENGGFADIVKVEPFALPVQVTVAVDNGPLSGDSLVHYRTGLAGLVRALPA